jgi:polar amino acid transport system permease protein
MPPRKRSLFYSLLSALIVIGAVGVLTYSLVKMDYDWSFGFLWQYVWNAETNKPGLLLHGLWGTLRIALVAILIGTLWGVALGLILFAREPVSLFAGRLCVDLFRNTPVLVQLYVAYFVIGTAFDISAETAGVLTLSLFCGAYIAEMTRGQLDSFEKGQLDAARSLGLTPMQIGVHIVAPQAARRMLPALVGQFVSLVKDSSLVSVISLTELTKAGLNIVAVSFKSFETWFLIAALYLLINQCLSSAGRLLEEHLSKGQQHAR